MKKKSGVWWTASLLPMLISSCDVGPPFITVPPSDIDAAGKAGAAGAANEQPSSGIAGSQGGIDPTKVQVRVAHFSPDAGALNVCVRPNASGAAGFVKLGDVSVAFKQVTATYVEANAGIYDVRVVAGDQPCSGAGIVADQIGVALPGGKQFTVVAEGTASASFSLKVLTDTAAATDKASLRLVHASPATPVPVDAGVYDADKKFVKVFANVNNAQAVAAAGGGYALLDDVVAKDSEVEIRNAETGAYVATVAAPADIAKGAVASIYAYDPETGAGPGVAFCPDSDAGQNGVITCTDAAGVDRKSADDVTLRLAHMASSVSSAIKACAKPTSFPTWTATQYVSAALAQYKTTDDQSLPGSGGAFRADSWDVKLVAESAVDCTAEALPNATFTVDTTAGLKATAVVAGVADATSEALGLYAIAMENEPVGNQFKGRLIHVATGAPAVDVGTVTGTNSLTPLWTNAEFGKAAANGYQEFFPVPNGIFGAAPTGTTTATFKTSAAISPANTINRGYGFYVVGKLDNGTGLQLVRCIDSDAIPFCFAPVALQAVVPLVFLAT